MENRRSTLIWIKDLIDHMNQCYDQLQWASEGPTTSYLADSLLVDLRECNRLAQTLKMTPSAAHEHRGMAASA